MSSSKNNKNNKKFALIDSLSRLEGEGESEGESEGERCSK